MVPSLPIELPVNTKAIEVADPIECGMLRFGLPCCNDAYLVFVCPESAGCHRLIGVCQMCIDDATEYIHQETGKTWIGQLEDFVNSDSAKREWL